MRIVIVGLITMMAFLPPGSRATTITHTLTLKDGRTLEAEVIRYDAGTKKVQLKRLDGKVVKVNVAAFIPEDQHLFKTWRPPPERMAQIPAGTNTGIDPDFGEYTVSTTGFYMDQYEVTKAVWNEVYKWAKTRGYEFDHSGEGRGSDYPVNTINWYDCVKWCNARSQMEKREPCYTVNGKVYKTGQHTPDCDTAVNGFRLATCEEWEYAARGGLEGKRFPWGDTISHERANYNASNKVEYDDSSGTHPTYRGSRDVNGTSPAGSFAPNGYGLYDLVGNANEWCWDPRDNGDRCVRGCSATSSARYGRCGAAEDFFGPDHVFNAFGFRTLCK